jgi:hypothetical protein
MNKHIEKILDAMKVDVKDNLLYSRSKKPSPLKVKGVGLSIYSRGDENSNNDTHFFNPISDVSLRGLSPAMETLISSLSKELSKTVMILSVLILEELKSGSTDPKIQKLFKGKITLRMIKELKVLIKESAKTVPFTLNISYGTIINKKKTLVSIGVLSNISKMIGEHEFSEEFNNIFNNLLSEGIVTFSNEKKYTTYDAVQKGYNLIAKRINRLLNIFDGVDKIILLPLPSIDKFEEGDDLYFKRATPFRDLVSTDVESLDNTTDVISKDVSETVNMFGQIEYGGREQTAPKKTTNTPFNADNGNTVQTNNVVQSNGTLASNNGIALNVPTPVVQNTTNNGNNNQMQQMQQMMMQMQQMMQNNGNGVQMNNGNQMMNNQAQNGIQLNGGNQLNNGNQMNNGIQLNGGNQVQNSMMNQNGVQMNNQNQMMNTSTGIQGNAFGFGS